MLELSESFAPSRFPNQFCRIKRLKIFKKYMVTFIVMSTTLTCHQVSCVSTSKKKKNSSRGYNNFFYFLNWRTMCLPFSRAIMFSHFPVFLALPLPCYKRKSKKPACFGVSPFLSLDIFKSCLGMVLDNLLWWLCFRGNW